MSDKRRPFYENGKKRFIKKGYSNDKSDDRPPKQEEITTRDDGTVEFLNINMLKKKTVRGLLRKRAKQYDSDEGDDRSLDSDNPDLPLDKKGNPKKTMLKNSFASAFQTILNKKIDESK
jgi:hypothetical protein